jgi:Uncharacterized conserved protein
MARKNNPTSEAIGWSWAANWRPHEESGCRLFRWFGVILSVLLLGGMFAYIIGFFMFIHTLKGYENHTSEKADAIVTMTGAAQRIDESLQLLAQGQGKRMLISGVNEQTTRDEIMRLNPTRASLFSCCVDLDYMARNTIGNAIQTKHWANQNGFKSLIIVTSNYHMPRTLVELQHVMPQIRKIPFAVSAGSIETDEWWRNGTVLRMLVSEYTKYLISWGRTKIEKDPERSTAARLLGKPVKPFIEPAPR